MKCNKCKNEFEENQLHESHDVPCYVFPGIDGRERKQEADKHGRKRLCKKCHDIYEKMAFSVMVKSVPQETRGLMIDKVKLFAKRWFRDENSF